MTIQVEVCVGSPRAAACPPTVIMAITIEVEADGDSEAAETRYPTIAITMEVEAECDHHDAVTTCSTTIASTVTIRVEAGGGHKGAIALWHYRRGQGTLRRQLHPRTTGWRQYRKARLSRARGRPVTCRSRYRVAAMLRQSGPSPSRVESFTLRRFHLSRKA